jgi:TRAP-type C4-dicarboxylate transport system permease small subunit
VEGFDVEALEKVTALLNRILIIVAGVVLAIMIFLTCSNVFIRTVWVPIKGTYELMGYFGAVITALALGYTQKRQGQIAVDILVLRFSRGTQRALNAINNLVCMVFFAIVAWRIAQYATTLWRTGEVTETLRIVYYPFTYSVALGCAVLALVCLTDFLKSLIPERKEET